MTAVVRHTDRESMTLQGTDLTLASFLGPETPDHDEDGDGRLDGYFLAMQFAVVASPKEWSPEQCEFAPDRQER